MKTKILILLSILLSFLSQAQQRGNYSFASPAAMPLMNTLPMREVVHSQKVVGSVGGISYDQVAKPESTLQITSLTIEYAQNNFNGERLMLNINGKKVYTSLFDWQLIPIAKFADSESYSCFTYFGDLANQKFDQLVLDNGGHILNYHPSFSNTLLGLRLMDMDLLYMYNFTCDLPKLDNKYILGGGEIIPDINSNILGYNNFIFHINTIKKDLKQNFRSYILSDYNRSLTFSIQNDSLKLNEYPFYFCWRLKSDNPAFNPTAVRNSIILTYEKKRTDEMFIIDSLIAKADLYKKYYDLYSGGTFIDLVNLSNDRQIRVDFLKRYYLSDLYNLLINISYDLEANSPEYLEEFSIRMSNTEILKKTNPAVWDANVKVMRYAAFFRYLKLNYPVQWLAFLHELEGIVPKPEVITPTVIFDTGNSVIENALLKVSVHNSSAQKVVQCYPNPFNDFIILNNSNEMERISIYGTDGRLYFEELNCPKNFRLNTSKLFAGVYSLVVVEKETNQKTFKIVKK